MKITEVKIRNIYHDKKLKAIVSITLDHVFAVHDIKIIDANDHLFVAMPSRMDSNGRMRDVAHPINHEMRVMMEQTVLREYENTINAGIDNRCHV